MKIIYQETYKENIAKILQTEKDRIFLYWKGRVALYAILKSIGIEEGDEVIMPAFTCVVVANAIIYLGGKPVYADIEEVTYNVPVINISNLINSKTKAIICQNTFGLSSYTDEIAALGRKNNIITIEDATHGFGGTYKGKPNGSNCDTAFYSTQWNKPFSTGIGGFALINNNDILNKISEINKSLQRSSIKDKIILKLLLIVRNKILNNKNYWTLLKAYRWLSKKNIVIGSSSGEEISGINIPRKYFKTIDDIQCLEGIKNIKEIDIINKLRKENAKKYSHFLKEHKKQYVPFELFEDHLFLKYPILVKDREIFEKIAEKNQIEISNWFCSPLHPLKCDLKQWNFENKNFPVATSISNLIINLPTEKYEIKQIIDFLEENIEYVI